MEAAHRAGIPVMAGGEGFGRDEHAALRVGADAWARTMIGATRQLAAWAHNRPEEQARPFADTEAWSAIELARLELVNHAMLLLSESSPSIHGHDERQLVGIREDVAHIFQFLAVSVLVDDARIFVEFLVWLSRLLTSRNLPSPTADATLPALTMALASAGLLTNRVERLLRAGADVLHTTGASES